MKTVFIFSASVLLLCIIGIGVYVIVKKLKDTQVNKITLIVSIIGILISACFSIYSMPSVFETNNEALLNNESFQENNTDSEGNKYESVVGTHEDLNDSKDESKNESSDANVDIVTNNHTTSTNNNSDTSIKAVEKGDKWGYVDGNGNIVIPFIYDYADDFYDGFAAVRIDYKWGFINQDGETVIPFDYTGAWSFINGLAPVHKDNLWGFINKNNELVIDFQYRSISKMGGAYYDENDNKIIY